VQFTAILFWVTIWAGLLGPAAAVPGQQNVYSVDVRLVPIMATVRDASGDLVGALTKDDFTVYDNGVRQEVSFFERQTAQPLSVALLVDTSPSTAKDLRYETDSVSRFLKAVYSEGDPEDAVSLFSFSDEVTPLAGFTRRRERIEEAMKLIKSSSGTSLYDAIYLVSRNLELRGGRRVLIVVTDGGDTTSTKKFHDALEALQRADAVLYPILVTPITNEAGRNLGGENALIGLANGTAGRVFTPATGPTLDTAFSDILKELRTQYFLGYYPRSVEPRGDRYHRLEVKLRNPDLRVNARTGYYEESERPPASERQRRGPAPRTQ
jgi:Ca-activated chloride channel family protein